MFTDIFTASPSSSIPPSTPVIVETIRDSLTITQPDKHGFKTQRSQEEAIKRTGFSSVPTNILLSTDCLSHLNGL